MEFGDDAQERRGVQLRDHFAEILLRETVRGAGAAALREPVAVPPVRGAGAEEQRGVQPAADGGADAPPARQQSGEGPEPRAAVPERGAAAAERRAGPAGEGGGRRPAGGPRRPPGGTCGDCRHGADHGAARRPAAETGGRTGEDQGPPRRPAAPEREAHAGSRRAAPRPQAAEFSRERQPAIRRLEARERDPVPGGGRAAAAAR
mmetsp:Transcript_11623/g.32901  ORF Transcript_11623/g.32901 Transcript_11623/m.32901 type:complete len:205 (+) Transcript_11623:619-1233(+)